MCTYNSCNCARSCIVWSISFGSSRTIPVCSCSVVNAQNAAATSNYEHQLKIRKFNWDRERFRYNRQLLQYENILDENAFAANRAYVGEQEKLNNIYRQAAFKQQANLLKLIQNTGTAAASGQVGKNTRRLDSRAVREFGLNQEIAAELDWCWLCIWRQGWIQSDVH